jgi:hypothetical protein
VPGAVAPVSAGRLEDDVEAAAARGKIGQVALAKLDPVGDAVFLCQRPRGVQPPVVDAATGSLLRDRPMRTPPGIHATRPETVLTIIY